MIRFLRRRWWLILLPVAIATVVVSVRLPLSLDQRPAGRDAADADKTSLVRRLEDANRRLVEQEKKLDEYAQRRGGQLATELPSYLRGLDRAQTQLQSVQESIKRAEDERNASERQRRDAGQAPDRETKLRAIDRQIRAARVEEGRVNTAIAGYQANIDRVITGDAELRKLTQDYRTLRATYSNLLAEREKSRPDLDRARPQTGTQSGAAAAEATETRHNQKQRFGVMIVWIVGGLAAGLALAAVVEYRGSTFKTERDVQRMLTLPVLAVVPVMTSEQREHRGRRKWASYTRIWMLVVLAGSAAALILWSLQS